MTRLMPGDPFPPLTLNTTDGERALPDILAGDFGIILFNRGTWCPFCAAQLKAFQRAVPKLAENDANVVALWTEDENTTREFVEENNISFPIGYGADAAAIATATGAFVNTDPTYLQSTGFVLGPSGEVLVSVYSSGAIGRLLPEDVIGLIRHVKSLH